MKSKIFVKNKFIKVIVFVWVITITVIMSLQMANHLVSMPLPTNAENFVSKIKRNYFNDAGYAVIVHTIYEKCSCTNSLLRHLVERGLQASSKEVIFIIGSNVPYESELIEKGYLVFKITQERFANEYEIEAVPLLTIINNKGDLMYMGGYFKTSETRISFDKEIIQQTLTEGKFPEPLPLYGCAISERLQKYLDPFRLNEL